jgi:hypothetical protein
MSTITLSTCFDNIGYKNLVDLYVNNDLQGDTLRYIESITSVNDKIGNMMGSYSKVYKRRPDNIFTPRYPR